MHTPIRNYHTHTWRCQHARGEEAQYVQNAVDAGFAVLGFTDHTPWPYESGFISGMRMRLDQFEDYRQTILGLRERYRGQIEIPLGLECEAFPEYFAWLRDFKAAYLDYVILGNHYDYSDEGDHSLMYPDGGFYFGGCVRPEHIRRYAERTMAGMATGLFDYVAHPDLFLFDYPAFDAEARDVSRDLCQCARDLDLPLEYNLLGLSRREHALARGGLGYANPDFWAVAAQTGCKAVIGFDAHSPEAIQRLDLYESARRTLGELGVEILDALPGVGEERN